jgi:hypothetical protein
MSCNIVRKGKNLIRYSQDLQRSEQPVTEDKGDGESSVEVGGDRLHDLLPQLWNECIGGKWTNQES